MKSSTFIAVAIFHIHIQRLIHTVQFIESVGYEVALTYSVRRVTGDVELKTLVEEQSIENIVHFAEHFLVH